MSFVKRALLSGVAATIAVAGAVMMAKARPPVARVAVIPAGGDARPRELVSPIRPSAALDLPQMTLQGRVATADSIVVARCVGRRVDYGPGGNIFTFYRFETKQVIKGVRGSSFELRLLGGTIGDTTIPLGIDRDFQEKTDYVLLLGTENLDGFPTLDPGAVFVVQTSVDLGRQVVVPGVDGFPIYDSANGRPIAASPDWVLLDDLVYSLKRTGR
jgi:hypothetical protein